MFDARGDPSDKCVGNVLPHRRRVRLAGYDYSQPGTYFITICTHRNECLFGDVVNDVVRVSDLGGIAYEEWTRTAEVRDSVTLDAFVIMPNHLHGIIVLSDAGGVMADALVDSAAGARFGRPTANSLSTIVGGFKASVTHRINSLRGTPGGRVWQRGFYEEVVRSDKALGLIREYVANNAAQWSLDRGRSTSGRHP